MRCFFFCEFIEEQIYNWTYSDEQEAKLNWRDKNNPYLSLPRMVMMTYQLPDSITKITSTGEFDEFDLNTFFKAEGQEDKAKFKYENEVQKWLDLIRGTDFKNIYLNLKLGENKPLQGLTVTPVVNFPHDKVIVFVLFGGFVL